ncbi:hypothetical protein ACHAWU_004552 [Discostella pseudostelligera]|uniref:Enoyl reductase (ER) domain-containing protein n=1 Tax=Discostella pseudostelligera TaxID=259834 RepID=A0ABD3MV21_9STRA
MKAVIVESTGGVDALVFKSKYPIPCLVVPAGHALVRNEFAGLNLIDTYHRSGLYPRECPFVMGQEGGGRIAKLSDDENSNLDFKVGDRVAYGSFGSYAEFTIVSIDKLVPVPDDLDMSTAVACVIQGMTAHYLSTSVGAGIAKPGDWVLVYGVGSGTGQWTAQMFNLQGYRVIGITSRVKILDFDSTEAAASEFGCEKLIVLDNIPGKSYSDYNSIDIASEVMNITMGGGCKLVIDGIGKSTYEISLKCLSTRGLFVSFGNASGAVPAFPVINLLPKSAYMTRPKLNDYVASRVELLARANEIFQWVRNGDLKIKVELELRLEDVAYGHTLLEDGKTKGKVLYKIN